MGLYDTVHAHGPEFVCDQGHAIGDMQTKDLGQTMGVATIEDGRIAFRDGGWGGAPTEPITETIRIYGDCGECPAFVQPKTGNLVTLWVEFKIVLVEGRIVWLKRISETRDEFLARVPNEPYMKGCLGPMTHEEAAKVRDEVWRQNAGAK